MRIRFEYWLLVSFLLGVLIAYVAPTRIDAFSVIVDTFITVFMSLAPVIVFVIIFNSTCSLISEKDVAGTVIRASVVYFVSLVLGCALFASIVLSSVLPSSYFSAGLSFHTFEYIAQIMLASLLRPVTMALILGVILAFASSHTSFFRMVADLSKRIYGTQEQAFRLLLKVFPAIAMSLGGTLYYNLGRVSLEVYIVAMSLTLILGLAALATIFILVQRVTHTRLGDISRYSTRMFAVGLSTGSSYVALPLALKIFREHFNVSESIGDLVLSLGASLNRCGSVMGVLVVTFVAARYIGMAISWQQMLLLAIPVALIGFGSPGIQGGTLLVAMPVILYVITPLDSAKFVAVALALFVGGTTFIQAAVNNVASGYIALLVGGRISNETPMKAQSPKTHRAVGEAFEAGTNRKRHVYEHAHNQRRWVDGEGRSEVPWL